MKRTKPPKKRESQHKGRIITSDYIPYYIAMLKGRELLWNGHPVIGFYIILAVNTGMRAGDILRLKHSQLANKRTGDRLELQEHKTKKLRRIQLNEKVITAYKDFITNLKDRNKYDSQGYIFTSKKNTVYAIPSLNTILKEVFAGQARNISTHSLRKSFGRHVYEVNGESERALMLLSEIFSHSSMAITRRYLGLRQEEISDIYMNL